MHATNSTAHSHTDSCNPHTPTTTHPDSHIDSPSSYGLHTLPWDSVTCIYSYSTHTITQLALRPAQDEVDRDALEALYEQGKEEVALAESEGLPSSARAFRVEQRAETVGQGATGSSSSGYSLSFLECGEREQVGLVSRRRGGPLERLKVAGRLCAVVGCGTDVCEFSAGESEAV
ncbi:hypothetical protein AAT19DRAFT_13059 [Rhodotorula toruloides]|uniref:Uncharacterized protein n=1 Tax=Rhodotorula toruloides TaxID=5286 RepID=A0A2T0ADG2_RHOTO|nr:hypothetical protein AAT19DRAFT_13059 [Rhodotorula toruloides]